MAMYKGVEINDQLHGLVHAMSGVEEYRENLQNLQGVWDNLTLLGQLSGTGTDMTGTRQAFNQLTGSLLNNLGNEILKKTVMEMKSKAQVAVDIMIRNLFERTADIGFLATDRDIRDYLLSAPELIRQVRQGYGSAKDANKDVLNALNTKLLARFAEYVKKYSVYDNIILLDPEGQILIQLNGDPSLTHSTDPLIRESLETAGAYVETFRPTDLAPGGGNQLIYSYRVTPPDSIEPIGVLCLCFRFEDETQGIFGNLCEAGDWAVISLLDEAGRVIASSDPYHIPVGAPMEVVSGSDYRVVRFAGREYLATTRATQGYQGYMGQGWRGHVMLPVQYAFCSDASDVLQRIQPDTLNDVMSNPSLFNEELRNIPLQADKIQRELNRSVWNGNVRQSSGRKAINPAFSKVLLWEISNTGLKTRDEFERSIGNLHETVVSTILEDSQFLASLAIDIMDRNLYERANDCRWWALTSAFREQLNTPDSETKAAAVISEILEHINGLYTVYSSLLVFDRTGRVIAASNPADRSQVGRVLTDEWVRTTLHPADSQSYTVSTFEPSPLYHNRPTFIYAAAILAPDDSGNVVGGIGIVFDAEPQFDAMLRDSLPRNENGDILPGCFGVFANRDKTIIASTSTELRSGARLEMDEQFFALGKGKGIANIACLKGHYYAVGSFMSHGYREYKGPHDPYQNNVVAMVFVPLGDANIEAGEKPTTQSARPRMQLTANQGADADNCTEIATFHISDMWLGIHSTSVVEAIDCTGITNVLGANQYLLGYIMFQGSPIPVIDIRVLVKNNSEFLASPQQRQIVVIRAGSEDECLGIMVDSLGEIPEVPHNRIQPLSAMLAGENTLAESIVKSDVGNLDESMLLIISPDRIAHRLRHQLSGLAQKPAGAGNLINMANRVA